MTSGFYGNDINLYLPIDKIYPNYTTAQTKAYQEVEEDGVKKVAFTLSKEHLPSF